MSDNTQLITTLQTQLDQCMARRTLLSTAIEALEVTVRALDDANRVEAGEQTTPVKITRSKKVAAVPPVVEAQPKTPEFVAKKKKGKKGSRKNHTVVTPPGIDHGATQALMASSEIPQPKWSKKARQEARERMQRYWAERKATQQQASA